MKDKIAFVSQQEILESTQQYAKFLFNWYVVDIDIRMKNSHNLDVTQKYLNCRKYLQVSRLSPTIADLACVQ